MAEAAPSALGGLQPERFSPERVKGYIAEGQPAFVYFTADWCVSCKVNERVALATATILPQILLPQIVINALDRADRAAA